MKLTAKIGINPYRYRANHSRTYSYTHSHSFRIMFLQYKKVKEKVAQSIQPVTLAQCVVTCTEHCCMVVYSATQRHNRFLMENCDCCMKLPLCLSSANKQVDYLSLERIVLWTSNHRLSINGYLLVLLTSVHTYLLIHSPIGTYIPRKSR